jgi:predicted ATP-grasp superfamily ATP-dependent carboligase
LDRSIKVMSMIPAVVLGGTLNALGVVRSLAAGGMRIFVVDKGRGCPAAWSRFARFVSLPGVSGHDLKKALIDLSIRLGERPVLILTTDADVNTVSAFRKELEPFFRFSLPAPEMVRTLFDKAQFQLLGEREGLPVPRSVILNTPSDFLLIRTLAPPLAIKPADKSPLVCRLEDDRPARVENWEQGIAVAAKMMAKTGSLVVQEWIEGDDSDIYFCFFVCPSEGKTSAMFSGRKLVCTRPAIGMTAICCAAPEMDAELKRLTQQFTERVRYKGIGGLEFKRDQRSGKLVITEPTVGRTDWQEEIATLCGVNIPLAAYSVETGVVFQESVRPRSPVMWRSSIVYRLRPGLGPPGARLRDGYFRLNDPLPGLYYYAIELLPLVIKKLFKLARAAGFGSVGKRPIPIGESSNVGG